MITKLRSDAKILSEHFPAIAAEWDYGKNYPVTPDVVGSYSPKKFYWICTKGHSYESKVGNRTKGNSCPYYCSGKKVNHENCLATTHPEFVQEWDSDKNKLKPTEVSHGSGKIVFWLCLKGHSYDMPISAKTLGGLNCPYCSNYRICNDNCLSTLFPDIAAEWDYDRNHPITPDQVSGRSMKFFYWKCKNGHSYKKSINRRIVRGDGCSYCTGRSVCEDNCLATTHPFLIPEWDFSKNKVSPYEITYGSNTVIYWICPKKNHSYDSTIYCRLHGRNGKLQGCPYCSGRRHCHDNCLATLRPDLLNEWDWDRNNFLPTEITLGSGRKVSWLCQREGHTYQTTIDKKSECPICCGKRSHGELKIQRRLHSLEIYFKQQHFFKDCRGDRRRPLSFDFAVYSGEEIKFLIEFQGAQHYRIVKRYGGLEGFILRQKYDKIKREYCRKNNIPLLAIPYYLMDKIPFILDTWLLAHNVEKNSIESFCSAREA